MKSGLMGRIGKGDHGWTSRDYNIDVPCNRMTCPANSGARISPTQQTVCMMPSAIKINGSGLCQTGQDLIDAKPPAKPKPITGD